MPVWRLYESLITGRPSSIEKHKVKRDLDMLKKSLMRAVAFHHRVLLGHSESHSRNCVFLDAGSAKQSLAAFYYSLANKMKWNEMKWNDEARYDALEIHLYRTKTECIWKSHSKFSGWKRAIISSDRRNRYEIPRGNTHYAEVDIYVVKVNVWRLNFLNVCFSAMI